MSPLKKTLVSSAAVLALMAGPTFAQDTSVTTDTSVDSTLGDGEINTTATVESDETLKRPADDSLAEAGDAIEDTGEAALETAESAGEAALDTAQAAGEEIVDGADAAGEAVSDTLTATGEGIQDGAEALDPDATATADAEAQVEAETGPTTAGTLIGTSVASSAGEDIGEIDDVVRINGEVMAVVGVGGFLGLGEHSVALPLTELDWQGETVTAFGYTEEQLKTMDEFDAELATRVEAEEEVTLGRM
ncbi:PRC-barrel domain-containing protein [Pseudooceanicola sp.]|uniref:PRC-barrel domain-containing protein n=1 Tax=Pseudooceanicola sp. TaxID=1914328 RepID=UPI004058D99D